jgi:3-keto steroid reductase
MGLLRKCAKERPGRVIWISSIEAGAEHFDEDDLMGLRSGTAYECSKRLTDLLALTAGVDATRGSVRDFMATDEEGNNGTKPEILVAHPGIVTTSIVPLPPVLMSLWMATAYVMRWIGSPWHTNTAYNGAVSAVWLALASEEEIREKQEPAAEGKKVKWGSAVDRRGNARVEMTDVQGWGLDGSARPVRETWWGGGWGRRNGATDATREEVEGFVRMGARVWTAMEKLRVDWERRIRDYEERGLTRS